MILKFFLRVENKTLWKFLTVSLGIALIILAWILFIPPRLRIPGETNVAMGGADSYTVLIPIRNDGYGILRISGVAASCGCTSALFPKYIMPFSSRNITAVVKIHDPLKDREIQLAIISNDSSHLYAQTSIRMRSSAKIGTRSDKIRLGSIDEDALPYQFNSIIGSAPFDLMKRLKIRVSPLDDALVLEPSWNNGDLSISVMLGRAIRSGALDSRVEFVDGTDGSLLGEIELTGFIRNRCIEIFPPMITLSDKKSVIQVRNRCGLNEAPIFQTDPPSVLQSLQIDEIDSSTYSISLKRENKGNPPPATLVVTIDKRQFSLPLLRPVNFGRPATVGSY